jgi:hypothetical protein
MSLFFFDFGVMNTSFSIRMRYFVFIFVGHAFLPSSLRTPSMKYYDFETKDTVQRFCDAGVELGLPAGDDYNGETQEGAFFSQTTGSWLSN